MYQHEIATIATFVTYLHEVYAGIGDLPDKGERVVILLVRFVPTYLGLVQLYFDTLLTNMCYVCVVMNYT